METFHGNIKINCAFNCSKGASVSVRGRDLPPPPAVVRRRPPPPLVLQLPLAVVGGLAAAEAADPLRGGLLPARAAPLGAALADGRVVVAGDDAPQKAFVLVVLSRVKYSCNK